MLNAVKSALEQSLIGMFLNFFCRLPRGLLCVCIPSWLVIGCLVYRVFRCVVESGSVYVMCVGSDAIIHDAQA